MRDIWTLIQIRQGTFEEFTGGLILEARRLASDPKTGDAVADGQVTAIVMGPAPDNDLSELGAYGADRVLHVQSPRIGRYHGEVFSHCLKVLIREISPTCLLMVQDPVTDDLSQRLAAQLETVLIRKALDFTITDDQHACAMRATANGYLFEEVSLPMSPPPVVTFSPSVLFDVSPDRDARAMVVHVTPEDIPETKLSVLDVIEAAPENMELEDADIIVAGGRGAGKGDAFSIIHDLARAIGGSVAGTRPVIDWGTLPYSRQIGQTGKYVAPRLIINCGISGANEYTAGMEKAQHIIAIDQNPRARIFRFADVGVVADVHVLLPLLIERLQGKEPLT